VVTVKMKGVSRKMYNIINPRSIAVLLLLLLLLLLSVRSSLSVKRVSFVIDRK
jgi:hypothetical protein